MEQGILALFPGQGSQRVGMGKDLFEKLEIAKEVFGAADKALGFSLSSICFDGPEEKLISTAYAQPAILTVSTICFRLAAQVGKGKLTVCAAAGHSLGEYSALVAAESIKFEDAVALVHKRGRYMQEAVPAGKGKMIAVLGKELEEVEGAISKVTNGIVQAANINAPGQIVVAGEVAAVDQFITLLPGVKAKELQVSAPFHCALMKPAADNLARDLKATSITAPKFPVFANYSATHQSDPEKIRESLASQVCGKVRWVECMQNSIATSHPLKAAEFGYGSTLAGLLKRIDKSLTCLGVDSLESAEKLFQ